MANPAPAKKWTKKAIKTLTGTLSTFYLYNRPLSGSASQAFLDKFRAHVDAHRKALVLAGLREHLAIATERLQDNEKTAAHFESHPSIYGDSTPEMVARFRGYAADERAGVNEINALIARVEAEELPAEVLAFDPTA